MSFAQRAAEHLPALLARSLKRASVMPRYRLQASRCRQGFEAHGRQYNQPILFVAGLPKSGTSWLERMLAGYPGFHPLVLPGATIYELRTGGSHDYELPADFFRRLQQMLVIARTHVHGSAHNVALLQRHDLRHAVLYRDLRDVAVSYHFYVRQTPWHPHYPRYRGLSPAEGLARFAVDLLPAYAAWVESWQAHGQPDLCLTVRYESLLVRPQETMTRIARHFGLEADPTTIAAIVGRHEFARLRERTAGSVEERLYRKGVAGDWRNHFSPALKETYKRVIGDFLIAHGYEKDLTW